MAKNQIDFSLDNPENAAVANTKQVLAATGAEAAQSEGELEVAVGPEPVEEDKSKVTITVEDLAALKAQGDSAKAVKEGIEALSAKLGQPTVVQAPPANAPQQTAEEFLAEHSDDLFDKEKGPAVFLKGVKMVAEKEYGGMLQGLSTSLANTRRELLEAKDPHFKKYKAEIEALVAQQPPNIRMQPNVYELAWDAVRKTHQAEIEEETVTDRVAKAVEAKLKELGLDAETLKKQGGARPAAHVQSESRSAPVVTTAQKRTVRLPDAATRVALEAEAKRKGMDLEDLLRVRGYVQ